LGDRFVLPTESKDHYSEEFALLPNSYLCFTPPEFEMLVVPTPAIENKFITFGCFNNAQKVNKKVIMIWAKILKKISGSKLFFKGKTYVGDKINFITQCFEENQIDPNRIIFEGHSSRQALLKSYNQVDIALDPFPYPGGTTTCEALWMGVPTVTKKGNDFLSNVGQTISINSGHHHLCALDVEEYIDRSVSLSRDIEKLNRDRLKRRARILKSPLFDRQLFAEDFSKLMKEISNAG